MPENMNCSVFSYLEYWQSDPNNWEKEAYDSSINATDNYLDHFKFCLRNPTAPKDSTLLQQNCMANYGGPVDPAVALGGFLRPGK